MGYPNSGKSFLANNLMDSLKQRELPAILLDGDLMRQAVQLQENSYDLESRMQNSYRIARFASMFQKQGNHVIVANNSYYKPVQIHNREKIKNYFEVNIKSTEKTRRLRDGAKRLYSRFDNGEINSIPGLDLPADEPERPDLTLFNEEQTDISQLVNKVITKLF